MPTPLSGKSRVHPPVPPSTTLARETVACSSTYRSGPSSSLAGIMRFTFTSIHHDQESAQQQHCGRSPQSQKAGDGRAVSPVLGVVMKAIQLDLIHQVADLVARCLDQAKAQIFGRVLHAVVILGKLALRRDDHDRRGVNELPGL